MGKHIVLVFVGILLISLGIWIIVEKYRCKTELTGTFVRNNVIPAKATRAYAPVFSYEYEGKKWERPTFETFSGRKVSRFVPGQRYTIFLNARRPGAFVVDRKLRPGDLLLIGAGLLAMCIAWVSWSYP